MFCRLRQCRQILPKLILLPYLLFLFYGHNVSFFDSPVPRLTVMEISAYVLYQIIQNANLNELILLHYCSYQTKSKVYHFYMAFHIVLPVAFQRMRIIFFRYLIAFCQKLNYPHKRFYKFFIILKTL